MQKTPEILKFRQIGNFSFTNVQSTTLHSRKLGSHNTNYEENPLQGIFPNLLRKLLIILSVKQNFSVEKLFVALAPCQVISFPSVIINLVA